MVWRGQKLVPLGGEGSLLSLRQQSTGEGSLLSLRQQSTGEGSLLSLTPHAIPQGHLFRQPFALLTGRRWRWHVAPKAIALRTLPLELVSTPQRSQKKREAYGLSLFLVEMRGVSSHCANVPPAHWLPNPAALSLAAFGIRFDSHYCFIPKRRGTREEYLFFLVERIASNPNRKPPRSLSRSTFPFRLCNCR